jgi:hypothetical protein
MKKPIFTLAAAIFLTLPMAAESCGEKLVAIGGGVRIERIYRSQHPGSVVVVAMNDAVSWSNSSTERLTDSLRAAGHEVRVVRTPTEFENTVRAHSPNIVLAEAGQVQQLRARLTSASASGAVVPVLFRPTRAALTAAKLSDSCVASFSDWGVGPLLRIVDGVRSQQVAGQAVNCVGTGPKSDLAARI